MGKIDNLPKTNFDSNIPEYDKSQWFRFNTEDFMIYLEVLGISNDILQGKVMIQIKRPILWFLSKSNEYYNILVNTLTKVYGDGYPLNIPGIGNILNFQNDEYE